MKSSQGLQCSSCPALAHSVQSTWWQSPPAPTGGPALDMNLVSRKQCGWHVGVTCWLGGVASAPSSSMAVLTTPWGPRRGSVHTQHPRGHLSKSPCSSFQDPRCPPPRPGPALSIWMFWALWLTQLGHQPAVPSQVMMRTPLHPPGRLWCSPT